jgi:hypothetical protein
MLILFADDAETLEREAITEDEDDPEPQVVTSEQEVRLEAGVA